MAEKQIFRGLLEKHENTQATEIEIPFDVEEVFGAKSVLTDSENQNRRFEIFFFVRHNTFKRCRIVRPDAEFVRHAFQKWRSKFLIDPLSRTVRPND